MRYTGFNFCFQNQLAPLQPGAYCDSSGGGPAKAISRSTAERKPSLSAVSNSKLEAAASQARAAAAAATATAAAAVAGSSSRNGQITIHVFDEARGARKDFSCDLRLLLREMGYFKGHLGGVLGPHELEMSVHCDIAVFSWLLEYVKASRGPGIAAGPELSTANCIPILISSDFLQMERLVHECLAHICRHVLDVVRQPLDMSCLAEHLLRRLAQHLTEDTLVRGWGLAGVIHHIRIPYG